MPRSALQLSDGRNLDAIAEAIQEAERCDRYHEVRLDEGCEGLDGCPDCLRLAAEAVSKVIGRN